MTFALILACTVAACFALRNPLKKWPMLFYVLAVIVDLFFIAGVTIGLPRAIWSVFFLLIQKCTMPTAIFVVVMYIGVLPRSSKAFSWLKPVRAELSIIAWILSLGHMVVYIVSYLPRLTAGYAFSGNMLIAFVLAVILLVLLLLLGITSFNFVKRHMRAETWKKVQKLAYPFFILTYVHILFMLAPAAFKGGIAAQASVVVYSVVFLLYVVLRAYRAWADKRAQA